MEFELLGNMFWFLLGALCYSVVSSLLRIYKLVSIFKDIEKSLINLLTVLDNNYLTFVKIRRRIAKEMMEEKPDLFKDVEVVERFDNLQYDIWRKNVLTKFFTQVPTRYMKYLDPWMDRELNRLSKELNDANISVEK